MKLYCYECGVYINQNTIFGYTTPNGNHYCSNCYEVIID